MDHMPISFGNRRHNIAFMLVVLIFATISSSSDSAPSIAKNNQIEQSGPSKLQYEYMEKYARALIQELCPDMLESTLDDYEENDYEENQLSLDLNANESHRQHQIGICMENIDMFLQMLDALNVESFPQQKLKKRNFFQLQVAKNNNKMSKGEILSNKGFKYGRKK